MKNISKELSPLQGYQLQFDDLLGDDMKFFNKDSDTPDSYRVRESLIEHSEGCECLDCEAKKEV